MANKVGNMIEVRVGARTQNLPIFVRMLDRESTWGLPDNGLKSVLTASLFMSIIGYPYVLPDMIGGNGYVVHPDYELFVRWTQLNAFLPAMQFSIPPWHFTNQTNVDVNKICKTMVDLHEFVVSPTLLKFAQFATRKA